MNYHRQLAASCFNAAFIIGVIVIVFSILRLIFGGTEDDTLYSLYVAGSLLFALFLVISGVYFDGAADDEYNDRRHGHDDDDDDDQ